MSASVGQYVELYDSARNLIGDRPEARKRLLEAGTLDDAFAPTDYGLNLQRVALPVDIAAGFGCDVPAVSAAPAAVVNDISPRQRGSTTGCPTACASCRCAEQPPSVLNSYLISRVSMMMRKRRSTTCCGPTAFFCMSLRA